MTYTIVSFAELPDLADAADVLDEVWPRFLGYSPTMMEYWRHLKDTFPTFQFVLLDEESGEVVARGNTVPVVWDGTVEGLPGGADDVLATAVSQAQKGQATNTLSALAAIVAPDRQGEGLSGVVIKAMGALARKHRFRALIAPVRPTRKADYPLQSMEQYLRWTRPDGAPFDPWIRLHWKLGATVLKIAPTSMTVTGRVADWERWTAMAFPETGAYVVKGALLPVEIDRETDTGTYLEPNVWMRHPV